MVRLEHVLETWRTIRQDTIQAVEDFAAGDMNYRPTADLMTFGEIARHIAQAGDGLAGLLLSGDDNWTVEFREKLSRHIHVNPGPDAASVAAALRESIARRTDQLAARPPEFFAQTITRFDGLRLTRLEMLQMLKEHELTHRAQLFMYMRLNGLVPATTRRRLAKQASK